MSPAIRYNGGLAKIYTKRGDLGETDLGTGKRVPKDDPLLEASGTIDELNAWFGLARSNHPSEKVDQYLKRIQRELFELGADLASPWEDRSSASERSLRLYPRHTTALEKEIDEMEQTLPKLHQFILPGGSELSSVLHLTRTVCRRAERRIVALVRSGQCNPEVQSYMNRLSDWLFMLARYSNREAGQSDTVWQQDEEER